MKTGYNFDPINNTLTISASFAKKASKVDSAEYDIMLKLRKDYSNLKVVKEEKTAKKQLTYKDMEAFIKLHRNSDELLKAFAGAKTLSRFHAMPFTFVKDWFGKQFPYFGDENLEMDADGFIVVKPSAENPASEDETRGQSLEVLKNQDSEGDDSMISASAEDSPVAEAV